MQDLLRVLVGLADFESLGLSLSSLRSAALELASRDHELLRAASFPALEVRSWTFFVRGFLHPAEVWTATHISLRVIGCRRESLAARLCCRCFCRLYILRHYCNVLHLHCTASSRACSSATYGEHPFPVSLLQLLLRHIGLAKPPHSLLQLDCWFTKFCEKFVKHGAQSLNACRPAQLHAVVLCMANSNCPRRLQGILKRAAALLAGERMRLSSMQTYHLLCSAASLQSFLPEQDLQASIFRTAPDGMLPRHTADAGNVHTDQAPKKH